MNASNSLNDASFIEPMFYFGLQKKNQIPEQLTTEQIHNYFEYSLKANPNDLSRHLQRIQFAINNTCETDLFAALCDLFITLGTLGEPLRLRLLRLSKKKLKPEHLQLLLQHMKDDRLKNEQKLLPQTCLFQNKAIDLIKICIRDNSTEGSKQSQSIDEIIHTADSYIENSQFETALDYMLRQLEQDPENEDLTIKLISLYKALNYFMQFKDGYEKFANNLLTSRYWDDAKQYFLDKQS